MTEPKSMKNEPRLKSMKYEIELGKRIMIQAMSMVTFSSLVSRVFMTTDKQQRSKYLTETSALVSQS